MDKHSPLPWKTSLVDDTAVMAKGEFVATTGFSPVDYEQNHERREADAALIVKAVNSHASLTEAVRVLTEALENIAQDCEADYPPSHGAIKHAARAALTTAKELLK